MTDISQEMQVALQRAKRLKVLRQMTGYTMQEFAEKCNVGLTTINYWENVISPKGITPRGARKVVETIKLEGISCSVLWLMEGKGEAPSIVDPRKLNKLKQQLIEVSQHTSTREPFAIQVDTKLQEEIELFKNLHPNNVIQTIQDDTMSPFYNRGDIVGGEIFRGLQMELANGNDCMIDSGDSQWVVRRFKLGTLINTYSFYCLNPEAGLEFPPFANIKIKAVAPITRIWKQIKY